MSWASITDHQHVSFTDAQGCGISTLHTVPTSNQFMTKADAVYYFSCDASLLSGLTDVQWIVKDQLTAGGIPITAISNITGSFYPTGYVYAGALTPGAATVTYQWRYCSTSGGAYTNIGGATSSNYLVSSTYIGYYLKVTATGYGAYYGSVTSAASTIIDGTVYYSAAINDYYTRNDCGSYYVGTSVYVSISANAYSAYGNQGEADILAINAAQQYANSNGTCVYAKPVITDVINNNYNPFRQWAISVNFTAINPCTVTIVVTVTGYSPVSVTRDELYFGMGLAGASFGFVGYCGYSGTTGGCPLYAGVYTTFDITITDTVNGYTSDVLTVTATPNF